MDVQPGSTAAAVALSLGVVEESMAILRRLQDRLAITQDEIDASRRALTSTYGLRQWRGPAGATDPL